MTEEQVRDLVAYGPQLLVSGGRLVVDDQVGVGGLDPRGIGQRGWFQHEAPAGPLLDGEPELLKAEG
jgi:hypothetical protein